MSRDTQPRLGVAPLVIVHEGDTQRVILGRRARGGNAGKWVIPGGGVRLGEHWWEAGEREFLEETGLRTKIKPEGDVLAVMEFITGKEVVTGHRICLVAWGELAGPLSDMHSSPELSEVRAFLWDEIPWDDVSPKVREVLEIYRPPARYLEKVLGDP